MRNVLLTIEYVGTRYHGWQRQKNTPDTVQQKIEEALLRVTGAPHTLFASGRTDEGVHALGQTANFFTDSALRLSAFVTGVNTYLPRDIKILSAKDAATDFNARYSAVSKTYIYKMYVSRYPSVFKLDRAACVRPPFDLQRVKAAVKHFLGAHDFTAFKTAGSSVKGTVRTIFDINVSEADGEIILSVTADGFLYNMVRIIAACLIKVGQGKTEPDKIPYLIESKNRALVRETAEAGGLYLESVRYDA